MRTAKPGSLRVVLDTNVYFSAFTNKGLPFLLWQRAVRREYTLVISPAIFRELGGVLRRRAGWEDAEIVSQLKLLARAGEIVSPARTIQAIQDDDDDNRILECAVEGKVDLIVSSDHHLRRLKTFQGIGILHPIDFRRTLG